MFFIMQRFSVPGGGPALTTRAIATPKPILTDAGLGGRTVGMASRIGVICVWIWSRRACGYPRGEQVCR